METSTGLGCFRCSLSGMESEPRLFLLRGTSVLGVRPSKHSPSGTPSTRGSSTKFTRSSLLVKLMNRKSDALGLPGVQSVRLGLLF